MKIYVLFTCDAWKSNSSMRLVGATTDHDELKRMIKKGIAEGAFEYEGHRDHCAGLTRFMNDGMFEREDYSLLNFGYVATVENGEVDL